MYRFSKIIMILDKTNHCLFRLHISHIIIIYFIRCYKMIPCDQYTPVPRHYLYIINTYRKSSQDVRHVTTPILYIIICLKVDPH